MAVAASIELAFSHNYGAYGSKEHYAHFLWGYALPGLHEAIQQASSIGTDFQIVLEDCGSIMNEVSVQIFGLLTKNIVIRTASSLSANRIYVPRWDIMAHYQSIVGKDAFSENPHILKFRDNVALRQAVSQREFGIRFASQIAFVRDWVTDRTTTRLPYIFEAAFPPKFKRPIKAALSRNRRAGYLVLKRSDEPEYYSASGSAEIKTYGKTRRTLTDIDEAVSELRRRGHNVTAYEPGIHPIAHQIMTFSRCDGVVGIKGAEFSNVLWMRRKSKIVIITPDQMKTPPLYIRIGDMLGIDSFELGCGTTNPSMLTLIDQVEGLL